MENFISVDFSDAHDSPGIEKFKNLFEKMFKGNLNLVIRSTHRFPSSQHQFSDRGLGSKTD